MIVNALVCTSRHGDGVYSVETIVCFDVCEYCGSYRTKIAGGTVYTNSGNMNIHHIYCNCEPYIDHDKLNDEWLIIRDMNEMGIQFEVDISP